MPTETQVTVAAFAHCPDPRCEGGDQEPVQAIQRTVEVSYLDVGGTLPGIDHSHDYLNFVDEAQAPCPVCSRHRELSVQERPVYMNASGQDPMYLLRRAGETDKKVQSLQHDLELDLLRRDQERREMRDMVERQQQQIEALTSALEQKANKSGRKPAGQED